MRNPVARNLHKFNKPTIQASKRRQKLLCAMQQDEEENDFESGFVRNLVVDCFEYEDCDRLGDVGCANLNVED